MLGLLSMEPGGLPLVFGGGGGPTGGGLGACLVPESMTMAVCVIIA
jgi:hypothetical protein